MKQVLLSDQEIQALIGFIDQGVRSQGLAVAGAGLSLAVKLQAAQEVPEAQPEKESTAE